MIKIQNLNHKYKNREEESLKNINLHIKKGERVALIGPSGSGKSTLIKCLNKLIEPNSGDVFIEGKNLSKLNKKDLRKTRRDIGLISQEFNLLERESVLKNVLNGRLGHVNSIKSCLNIFEKNDYEISKRSLRDVGLLELKDERVSELSGGQKQRVAIARALAQQPKIILADEPFSSLDPKLIREMLALLQKICREKEITLIVSLHFVEIIKEHFPRMIGLQNGEIIFDDNLEEETREEIIIKNMKKLGYLN